MHLTQNVVGNNHREVLLLSISKHVNGMQRSHKSYRIELKEALCIESLGSYYSRLYVKGVEYPVRNRSMPSLLMS